MIKIIVIKLQLCIYISMQHTHTWPFITSKCLPSKLYKWPRAFTAHYNHSLLFLLLDHTVVFESLWHRYEIICCVCPFSTFWIGTSIVIIYVSFTLNAGCVGGKQPVSLFHRNPTEINHSRGTKLKNSHPHLNLIYLMGSWVWAWCGNRMWLILNIGLK